MSTTETTPVNWRDLRGELDGVIESLARSRWENVRNVHAAFLTKVRDSVAKGLFSLGFDHVADYKTGGNSIGLVLVHRGGQKKVFAKLFVHSHPVAPAGALNKKQRKKMKKMRDGMTLEEAAAFDEEQEGLKNARAQAEQVTATDRRRFDNEQAALTKLLRADRAWAPQIFPAFQTRLMAQPPFAQLRIIFMEFVEGCPVKPVDDLTRALNVAEQLSNIVGDMHEVNITHRDIKPDNILVEKETGKVRLVDFGLAWEGADDSADGATKEDHRLGNEFFRVANLGAGTSKRRKRAPQNDVLMTVAVLYYLVTGDIPGDEERLKHIVSEGRVTTLANCKDWEACTDEEKASITTKIAAADAKFNKLDQRVRGTLKTLMDYLMDDSSDLTPKQLGQLLRDCSNRLSGRQGMSLDMMYQRLNRKRKAEGGGGAATAAGGFFGLPQAQTFFRNLAAKVKTEKPALAFEYKSKWLGKEGQTFNFSTSIGTVDVVFCAKASAGVVTVSMRVDEPENAAIPWTSFPVGSTGVDAAAQSLEPTLQRALLLASDSEDEVVEDEVVEDAADKLADHLAVNL